MAIAFANVKATKMLGGSHIPIYTAVDITLDNSYPAGGYAITPENVGYEAGRDLEAVVCGPALNAGNLLLAAWDEATDKLRVFYPTGGTQAAPATPAQPAATVTPDAGAVAMTGSAAKPTLTAVTTPGAGKEVPTGADLSGFVLKAVCFAG